MKPETTLLPELQGRVSSLDGLRAISIAMVVYSHGSFSCGFPLAPEVNRWISLFVNGELGVHVFFVISGFIITLLLLKEEYAMGQFSIGRFYLRRFFRIVPVYYTFLVVVFLIVSVFHLNVGPREFLAALTFTTGWWEESSWLLGHTWSLAVEEQFYLLWPLTLFLVHSERGRFLVVGSVLACYPLLRVLVYLSPMKYRIAYLFITQGDSIMMGCLLALLLFYEGDKVRKFFFDYVAIIRLAMIGLIGVLTLIQSRAILGIFTIPLANTIESAAIAWLIGSFILNKDGLFWFFNSRILVFLGVVSYSWYLWQQLFLFECKRYFDAPWVDFPVNVLLSLLAAIGSYFVIERSFERIKNKYGTK